MIKGIDIASREQETFQKVASGMYRYYGDKKIEDKEGETLYISTYYEDHADAGISALDFMKKCRLQELMDRDTSSAINEFSIGGQPVWLDKDSIFDSRPKRRNRRPRQHCGITAPSSHWI